MVCLALGQHAKHVPDNMNLAGQDVSLLASPFYDKEVRKMWTFGHTFNPRITVGNACRRDRPMVRHHGNSLQCQTLPLPRLQALDGSDYQAIVGVPSRVLE